MVDLAMGLLSKKVKISEKISSNLDIVPNFISVLIERLYHLPLDEDIIFAVKLCLQEAVINSVKHGNKMDKSKTVEIDVTFDENRLVLEVRDQGEGYHFKKLPDPTHPENIMKLEGRGVFLIRNLMDKVQFLNGGRTIKMTKKLEKGRRAKMDINVEQISGVHVAILEGEININNAMELKAAFTEIIKAGGKQVLVDFEKVVFIDSSGLAVLIDTVSCLQDVNGQLRLCNVNRKIKGIFEITKLHKLMDICDSREIGLKEFA